MSLNIETVKVICVRIVSFHHGLIDVPKFYRKRLMGSWRNILPSKVCLFDFSFSILYIIVVVILGPVSQLADKLKVDKAFVALGLVCVPILLIFILGAGAFLM